MGRTGARRRLALGLITALLINAALLALFTRNVGEVAWRAPADTGVALQLELTREAPARIETEPETSADGRRPPQTRLSPPPPPKLATTAAAQTPSSASATSATQAAPPSPPSDQGAKTSSVQGGADADLRARTAVALRKLGACSRVNSGTGDAQDKALCTPNFAAADGATIDTIPIGKRADYDAAHAKAGYLVPADAANPNFVTSQFKRGGTVWTVHAGCELVHGKWRCGVH
jgi:hypothetical protein